MPYLSFINNETIKTIVKALLTKGADSISKSKKAFSRNVIDPFSILFEMCAFDVNIHQWADNEAKRQAQKSLSNHIGDFHQQLLGAFDGWSCLPNGEMIDVVCPHKKIIAEIKNKHNTLKGSDKSSMYYKLEALVMKKGQQYKDYTAYYVEVIPKKPDRYNLPFTPPDASTGTKCPVNPSIRVIDGYSFYALASGVDDALLQIFNVLPQVMTDIKPEFSLEHQDLIHRYFTSAFLG